MRCVVSIKEGDSNSEAMDFKNVTIADNLLTFVKACLGSGYSIELIKKYINYDDENFQVLEIEGKHES